MAKVSINTYKSNGEEGSQEMHYGYLCTVDAEGRLVADVPEDMLQNELDARRVTLLDVSKEPGSIEDMKAGELILYAQANGLEIGDLKPQAGKEKILAAVKDAQAKKAQE